MSRPNTNRSGPYLETNSAPAQPMEEPYKETVTKVIEQEWTCLGFRQLLCWTVMEDTHRM